MPKRILHDEIAIVSGSSSGISAHIGHELEWRGANVIINYTYPKLREEAEKLAASLPTGSIAVEADTSTIDGSKKLVQEAIKEFGRVEILIKTAAFAVNKPFEE
ncbi:uncharacterized protein EKO05_0000017 [Ascochyta rabiei]|uniref:3-oxoacyl-[acyl-carrier-protein] reductase (NADPH) n=1 Tax=Didymella rabiei TaxID=5454 RepID=A0A163MDC8_DIDRA|nr:uncharacterized protein EKO05_0000017 [Ascochyta rabiei]KZM28617.1 3-oxoacyl-[acyl-carrier-protein] reductase (NADPH) [Ascochyta rabiei]UPX09326.1 hypothetical protein EKO05_0000017 [Ascochyta rabiei]